MSYTKGNWQFMTTDEGELMVKVGGGHDVYLGDMEGSCGECFANGYLIAAAPDLYEALKEMTDHYELLDKLLVPDRHNDPNGTIERARAALAKATIPGGLP